MNRMLLPAYPLPVMSTIYLFRRMLLPLSVVSTIYLSLSSLSNFNSRLYIYVIEYLVTKSRPKKPIYITIWLCLKKNCFEIAESIIIPILCGCSIIAKQNTQPPTNYYRISCYIDPLVPLKFIQIMLLKIQKGKTFGNAFTAIISKLLGDIHKLRVLPFPLPRQNVWRKFHECMKRMLLSDPPSYCRACGERTPITLTKSAFEKKARQKERKISIFSGLQSIWDCCVCVCFPYV